jgi:hypothetical protein
MINRNTMSIIGVKLNCSVEFRVCVGIFIEVADLPAGLSQALGVGPFDSSDAVHPSIAELYQAVRKIHLWSCRNGVLDTVLPGA